MAPRKIMIIRHAEKAMPGHPGIGVNRTGEPDPQSLTVPGWQRAGALACFFAAPVAAGIAPPDVIYAAGTGPGSPSRRSIETAAPLAAKLGCSLVTSFTKEETPEAAADALRQNGAVLMVWEHRMIPLLARALAAVAGIPAHWPPERFDMVWILDRRQSGWAFIQLPQCLLAGDRHDDIAS